MWGVRRHATYIDMSNYDLASYGAAVGLFDRLELSYARQNFQTGATGAKLGLGRNFYLRSERHRRQIQAGR